MKKAFLLVVILFVSVISTACINNLAVQELNNKAKDSLDKGDFQSAIERLKASIDLDSTFFQTHYNLGIAYTQAEKYPEAVETFKNAIKLKPDFADTYYSLAVAEENYAKGIIEGTIKDADKDDVNDKDDDNKVEKREEGKEKVLSKEEKVQVVKLFEDSISAYGTYLEKNASANDKQEVEEKIDYLKKQIEKYSSDNKKSAD